MIHSALIKRGWRKYGAKLTVAAGAAHRVIMTMSLARQAKLMVTAGALGVSGCISLETPDKPIVIELNINVTQEVLYRLADDASATIEEEADIF